MLFYLLLFFALLGDARIFLFVVNRIVLGTRRKPNTRTWLIFATAPLLLILTLAAAYSKIANAWLIVPAAIGAYWIINRIHVLRMRTAPMPGTSSFAAQSDSHLNNVYDIEVTHHEVAIDRLPPSFDGYRIAFLTDTHVAPFMGRAFYRDIIAQSLAFDPDLILLGGDFVTWERHIPLMADLLLTDLHARDGVFAILGNHDYWSNPKAVVAVMSERGVTFITNRSIAIARGEESIAIAGLDEVYRGDPDVDATFANIDSQHACIAISHHPDIVDLLGDHRIDLLLCGHTHGGQIRFPFFGAVVVPSKHEALYASGFHRVGNVLMYVSRGIGAVPPVRILCKPEIATFVLRRSIDAHETLGSLGGH